MKIVAGMGSIDDFYDYAEAGADEVFIGFVPEDWQKKYGFTTPLNRREVCFYNVQVGSYSELEILRDMVKSGDSRQDMNTTVTIAFNGLNFSENQYEEIGKIIDRCAGIGFDSIIIADLGLLLYLNKTGRSDRLNIHLSGEFGEINHFMLKELKRLGINRLIFHRKVSVENMAKIINECGKDFEYEAFILNENCHFNGAFCNSLHQDDMVPMCRILYKVVNDGMSKDKISENEISEDEISEDEISEDEISENKISENKISENEISESKMCENSCDFDYDYGLDNIEKLAEIGVTHLKIVGRGADSDYMKKCIERVRENIKELENA